MFGPHAPVVCEGAGSRAAPHRARGEGKQLQQELFARALASLRSRVPVVLNYSWWYCAVLLVLLDTTTVVQLCGVMNLYWRVRCYRNLFSVYSNTNASARYTVGSYSVYGRPMGRLHTRAHGTV